MRPVISPVNDPQLQKILTSIRECLCGGVSLDNFNFQVVEGTTAPTVDSEQKIIHSMSPRPIGWFPLIGDVYVQEISSKYIDVRSTKPGVNFKLILLGGSPVTGDSLVEVGSSSYQTTTQVIQQTPTLEITEVTDATIKLNPVVIRTSTYPNFGSAALPNNKIKRWLNDASYHYITAYNGTTPSTTNCSLVRYNKTTGIRDILTCGTDGIAAMRIFDGFLYACETRHIAGTLTIYKIDLSTFTIASTLSVTGVTIFEIADIYVDGSHLYVSGTSSSIGANSILYRAANTGGAGTLLTLGTGSARKAGKIISDGTSLWITEQSTAVTCSIYKVSKSSFSVSTTYTTGNRRLDFGSAILYNNVLWAPGSINTSKATGAQAVTYSAILFALDVVSGLFTEYPIPLGSINSTGLGNVALRQNIVEQDGYLYLISMPANTSIGIYIIRFDTVNSTFTAGWFPWYSNNITDGDNMSIDGIMIADAATGTPLVCNPGGVGAISDFEIFEVDFSTVS